jgi:predicted amidohydrolase
MKIACCQLDIAWEDRSRNYDAVRRLLDPVELPAGSLVVLPEMFSTGFSMNVAATREDDPAPTEAFLSRLARERQVHVVAGIVRPAEIRAGQGRNEAVVIDPAGRQMTRYCKQHPFSLAGETEHYEAGTQTVTFPWDDMTVAPFICYDLRFPELFRSAMRAGAELFVVIANWPAARIEHWITLLRARAIENLAFVAGVNRCGRDPRFSYPGRSLIIDPHGRVIADAGENETVITADLDHAALLKWRKDFPALRDMRITAAEPLA